MEFLGKILYPGFQRPFLMRKPPEHAKEVFSSKKVEGSPDEIFSREIPNNPYDFTWKVVIHNFISF